MPRRKGTVSLAGGGRVAPGHQDATPERLSRAAEDGAVAAARELLRNPRPPGAVPCGGPGRTAVSVLVTRVSRRRGAFGLDERRRPDPARVEEALRAFLAGRLPEAWPLAGLAAEPGMTADPSGRTLVLILPRGRAAMLRIERDPERPSPAGRDLAARCRAGGIPHAVVSSLDEGRAALRRLGLEPPPSNPGPGGPTVASVFGER